MSHSSPDLPHTEATGRDDEGLNIPSQADTLCGGTEATAAMQPRAADLEELNSLVQHQPVDPSFSHMRAGNVSSHNSARQQVSGDSLSEKEQKEILELTSVGSEALEEDTRNETAGRTSPSWSDVQTWDIPPIPSDDVPASDISSTVLGEAVASLAPFAIASPADTDTAVPSPEELGKVFRYLATLVHAPSAAPDTNFPAESSMLQVDSPSPPPFAVAMTSSAATNVETPLAQPVAQTSDCSYDGRPVQQSELTSSAAMDVQTRASVDSGDDKTAHNDPIDQPYQHLLHAANGQQGPAVASLASATKHVEATRRPDPPASRQSSLGDPPGAVAPSSHMRVASRVYVSSTCDSDVIFDGCARGIRGKQRFPGNQHFYQLVRALRKEYLGSSREKKQAIAQEAVDAIHQRGGRFLRKDDYGWYEVSPQVARRRFMRDVEGQESSSFRKCRYHHKNRVSR